MYPRPLRVTESQGSEKCFGHVAGLASYEGLTSETEGIQLVLKAVSGRVASKGRLDGNHKWAYLDVTSSGDPFGAPLPSSTDASPHRGFVQTIADAPARTTCVKHLCGIVASHLQKTDLAGLAGRAANCVRSICSSLVCSFERNWRRVDCPQMVA